jgi:hypothetical protein
MPPSKKNFFHARTNRIRKGYNRQAIQKPTYIHLPLYPTNPAPFTKLLIPDDYLAAAVIQHAAGPHRIPEAPRFRFRSGSEEQQPQD